MRFSAICLCIIDQETLMDATDRRGDVPAYDPIELRLRLPTRAFPHTRRGTRSLGRALLTVLGFVPVEPFLTCWRGLPGRPQADRAALARAFSVRHLDHPRAHRAPCHRRAAASPVRLEPGRGGFSRAFSDFALPSRLHEALIDKTLRDHLVGHVSRDSTAILRSQPRSRTKRLRRNAAAGDRARVNNDWTRRPEGWRASPT